MSNLILLGQGGGWIFRFGSLFNLQIYTLQMSFKLCFTIHQWERGTFIILEHQWQYNVRVGLNFYVTPFSLKRSIAHLPKCVSFQWPFIRENKYTTKPGQMHIKKKSQVQVRAGLGSKVRTPDLCLSHAHLYFCSLLMKHFGVFFTKCKAPDSKDVWMHLWWS